MTEEQLAEIEEVARDIGYVGWWTVGGESMGATEIILALVAEVRRIREQVAAGARNGVGDEQRP